MLLSDPEGSKKRPILIILMDTSIIQYDYQCSSSPLFGRNHFEAKILKQLQNGSIRLVVNDMLIQSH
jgi:hypothetical protein